MAQGVKNNPNATEKACSKCSVVKPMSEFRRHPTTADNRESWCKACYSAWQKVYSKRPDVARRRKDQALRRFHGIGIEEFESILERQGGGCAVCGRTEHLHVDHDHSCCPGQKSCGKCIRGILCGQCNQAYGLLYGNPDTIASLLKYTERQRISLYAA